jgi:hypothetical protein
MVDDSISRTAAMELGLIAGANSSRRLNLESSPLMHRAAEDMKGPDERQLAK